ncbi:putative phage abortive infection protein [Neisseria elongata]|uniref:putative phage abortive infection protein n=1 Tax=Neisseria elongata TaxID=495 RepID=UPI000D3C520B|nr:putative phage abortive infection protein [Neisseria elongata]
MNKWKFKILSLFVFVIVVLIWWYYPVLISKHTGLVEQDKLGQWGDTYGGLNTIFTGLAMVGAFFALYAGNKERNSRQFEDHFFQQLNSIRDIIAGISLFKGKVEYKIYPNKNNPKESKKYEIDIPENISGRIVFITLRDNFILEKIVSHSNGNIGKYEDFYKEFLHRVLSHYFRAVYTTIKYVDSSSILNKEQKTFYIHMLRAQISSDELFFLFYSGLSRWGIEKFKPLIEKYSFFEHLQNEISSTDLIKYNKSAYGDNHEICIEYDEQQENQRSLKNKL